MSNWEKASVNSNFQIFKLTVDCLGCPPKRVTFRSLKTFRIPSFIFFVCTHDPFSNWHLSGLCLCHYWSLPSASLVLLAILPVSVRSLSKLSSYAFVPWSSQQSLESTYNKSMCIIHCDCILKQNIKLYQPKWLLNKKDHVHDCYKNFHKCQRHHLVHLWVWKKSLMMENEELIDNLIC